MKLFCRTEWIETQSGGPRLVISISSECDKTKDSRGKETENRRFKGRKKQRKRNTNLTWHLRHKERESLKENKQKPQTRSLRPNHKKGKDTIAQFDGNNDPISGTEIDDTPLENVLASTYGWHKAESPNYPKGIKFWSDPNKPPEVITTDTRPLVIHQKTNRAFVWKPPYLPTRDHGALCGGY